MRFFSLDVLYAPRLRTSIFGAYCIRDYTVVGWLNKFCGS